MAKKGVRVEDKAWLALKARVAEAGKAHVKVGVLSQSPQGAATHATGGITVVELAAIHEFGSPAARIPERSFVRRTFAENRTELSSLQARIAGRLVAGALTGFQALSILGSWASTAIKKTITGTHIPPPLAPATVARKGSDRPLVDSGQLLNAITYAVMPDGTGEE